MSTIRIGHPCPAWACGALAVLLLAGCATPQAARDEARLTALYATRVRLDALAFAQSRDDLAQARTRAINALELDTVELERDLSLTRSVWQISENNTRLRLFDDLRQATELVATQQQQFEQTRADQAQALAAAQSGVKVRQDKLALVAKQLAQLAEPASRRMELEFYLAFVREVKQDVDKLKEEAKKGADDATSEMKSKFTHRRQ